MNDFSDIESQLRRLRPVPPSADLTTLIEQELAEIELGRASVPDARLSGFFGRWRRCFAETPYKYLWGGLGLATAAAAVLVLAQINLKSNKPAGRIAISASRTPAVPVTTTTPEFIPADFTRVVYHTSNDGLYFPSGSNQPVRRLRARARETFEWRNPRTGASLRVSYPSDEISFIPVSGQ
jgi:hypothetical protein